MSFNPEKIAELNLLLQFGPETSLNGIKVHHGADPALITAARRLYECGFTTLADGGYLTVLGSKAAEHAQALFTMLHVPPSE